MPAKQANPKPWKICDACHGDGKVDGLGVVNPEDFTAEEWEEYVDGAHDCACGACGGTGKVREGEDVIVRHNPDGTRSFYADEDDASEHFLRMAGG